MKKLLLKLVVWLYQHPDKVIAAIETIKQQGKYLGPPEPPNP